MNSTERLSPDPIDGGGTKEAMPSLAQTTPVEASAESREKAQKILKLYERAILAKEFETADNLDTTAVPADELKQVRLKTFSKLVNEIKKYNDEHYTHLHEIEGKLEAIEKCLHTDSPDVKETKDTLIRGYINKLIDRTYDGRYSTYRNSTYFDEIKEWKEKTETSDEELKKVVEDGYLRHQANICYGLRGRQETASSIRSDWDRPRYEKFAKEYEEVMPAQNIASLTKVMKEMGFDYSPKELEALKERGFVAYLEADGVSSFSYKEKIEFARKVSNLSEAEIHSKNVQRLVAEKFAEFVRGITFEKGGTYSGYRPEDNGDNYWKLESMSRSPLFPGDLSEYPEIQKLVDDKFKEEVAQLNVENGAYVLSEYATAELSNRSETIDPHKIYNRVEGLMSHAKSMKVSDEVLKSDRLKVIVSKYVDDYFQDIKGETIRSLKIGREELKKSGFTDEELDRKARTSYLSSLHTKDAHSIFRMNDLCENFLFSEEFKKSAEVVTAQVEYLTFLVNMEGVQPSTIAEFLRNAKFPRSALDSEHFKQLKEKIILNAISGQSNKSSREMRLISDKLDFGNCEEFLKSPTVQEDIKKMIDEKIKPVMPHLVDSSYGYEGEYFKSNNDGLSFQITERYKDAGKGVHEFVSAYNFISILRNQELIRSIFDESIRSEFRKVEHISQLRGLSRIIKTFEVFGLSKEYLENVMADCLIENVGVASHTVEQGLGSQKTSNEYLFVPHAPEIRKYGKEFGLKEIQLRRLALKSFEYWLTNEKNHSEETAKTIYDEFHLTATETEEVVKELYCSYIANGWNEKALAVKNAYKLKIDSADLDDAMQKAFIATLNQGNLYSIETQSKSLSPDFLKSEPVQGAGKALFLKMLSGRKIENARKLMSDLSLGINVANIMEANPMARTFIGKLQEKFPKLATKYSNSVDAFLSIYSQIGDECIFATLDSYPFLGEALVNNEQYGLKLLFKFDSLDKLSKSNIQTLFLAKQEIFAQRPEIDANSRDFRIALQNKLADYRRNSEITATMTKIGIDVESWLNYEEESFFDLGKQDGMVSEQIKPAVERIADSVDKFIAVHKEVMGEYEKELTAHKIPVADIDALRKKLETLRQDLEAARPSEKPAKIAGMEKGIAHLEKQIRSPKTVTAWSRFIGDIGRFTVLKNDIATNLEALKKQEQKIVEMEASTVGPREKRKEIQKMKGEIEKVKTDILDKSNKFSLQVNSFLTDRQKYLGQILGGERSFALTQEISEKIAEPLDHCSTDFDTIRRTLEDKREDELEGTTLRVGLWDRNPDVDLYMGNYTDCCIRIDSEHMGEESTIADYMTDLGMQIVAIYDEKKKVPVAAAWCWVGIDDDDEKAFVVDNVEANTEYSTKYKDQMTNALKSYIGSYARSIGMKKVVQGRSNNDLVIANMDSAYFKVGGYNRASGYYLEGEDNRVGGMDEE